MTRRSRFALSFPVQCRAAGLPEPVSEHRFSERKFRFDWAFVEQRLAVEQEGGVWVGGRHTRGAGFLRDATKYNLAAVLGWRLIRCTPRQVADGTAVEWVRQAMERR